MQELKDNKICNKLIDWFEKTLLKNSNPITDDFINAYKPKYDNRMKRQKQDQKEITELESIEKLKLEAIIKKEKLLISKLKKYRQSKGYEIDNSKRKNEINELRKVIDNGNFAKIKYETFFTQRGFIRGALGYLPPMIIKNKILSNKKKITRLLKYICDDSIP